MLAVRRFPGRCVVEPTILQTNIYPWNAPPRNGLLWLSTCNWVIAFLMRPFLWVSVGGHVKRTLWQMGSQMGTSVNLIQLFVFICPFQIFRKISFGCFGNPRVNLIRWKSRRSSCKAKFRDVANARDMRTRRHGKSAVSSLLKVGCMAWHFTFAIWIAKIGLNKCWRLTWMWSQPKAAKRIPCRCFLFVMDVHLLFDCIYHLRISYSGYLFMFGVLRTCSPNTRDSAGFAGFSLRVCAVTRVGWVGGISLGALCALRNFLANSLETIWRKFLLSWNFGNLILLLLQIFSDFCGNLKWCRLAFCDSLVVVLTFRYFGIGQFQLLSLDVFTSTSLVVLWYLQIWWQIIRYFGKHGLQRFERPALHNPVLGTDLHAIQIALLFTTSVGVHGLTLHLCNLDCKDWSQQMLKIDLDVVATKSCKKDSLSVLSFCHGCSFAFWLHLSFADFLQWLFIYVWSATHLLA